tara:strand:- start:125 stop:937 length:813 start_codon:yes stop_codon:yes gene_type:complete
MSAPYLLDGKKGLIMGVANERSIAWIVADAARRQGAELAFTFQNEAISSRVKPLAKMAGSNLVFPCDVMNEASIDAVFSCLADRWGRIDFVVHAIAYADREELKGRYVDTSRGNLTNSLMVSCYSFTSVARRVSILADGPASLLTFTFSGARRVVPSYNVMGVAKAALEASVKYLAADLGVNGIRVNAISSGPMRTLSGAAIGSGRSIYRWARDNSAFGRDLKKEAVANASVYLLSDLSCGVTGEIHYVDNGNNIIGITQRKGSENNENC